MVRELKYALLHEDGSLTSRLKLETPVSDTHFPRVFLEKLSSHGDKELFVDGADGKIRSAKEVKNLVTQLALGLIHHGVQQDDVVFGYCPNSSLYASLLFAVPVIGARFSGNMHTHPKADIKYQIQDSGAKVLVCCSANLSVAIEIADEVESVQTVVLLEEKISQIVNKTPKGKTVVLVKQLLERHSKPNDPILPLEIKTPPKETVAYIIYSSGSTGLPKGVLRTHFNIMAGTEGSPRKLLKNSFRSITTCHQPSSHFSGVSTILSTIYSGDLCVFNDGFRPETFLSSVEKYRVNMSYLAPACLIALSKSKDLVKKYDITSLAAVVVGGAPLPLSVVPTFKSITGCNNLICFYASSEGGVISGLPPGVENYASCGCPAPLHRLKIVDRDTGETLGLKKVGEIYDQAIDNSIGYLNRPDADKENFYEDKMGRWLKTGDAGYFDEDGLLYIVDRYKEVIKVDTFQVAPAELESLLLTHDDVLEAVVIGIPDPDHGEVPKAFIVPKNVSELPSIESLLNIVNDQVADFKKIRGGISFVESFPKISLGKIDRITLKKRPELLKTF